MRKKPERMQPDALPDELRGEQSSLEGLRASQARWEPGHETPGPVGRPADGVLVQVCMQCGKEYSFDADAPRPDLVCEKCGNGVFRSFFSVTGDDEVEEDFRAATERDLAPSDPEGDATRGDILDLNNP